jgi:hypothetical protein
MPINVTALDIFGKNKMLDKVPHYESIVYLFNYFQKKKNG